MQQTAQVLQGTVQAGPAADRPCRVQHRQALQQTAQALGTKSWTGMGFHDHFSEFFSMELWLVGAQRPHAESWSTFNFPISSLSWREVKSLPCFLPSPSVT